MEERTAVVLGAIAGALVGGAAAYLLFTERGRRLRDELEPRMMALAREVARARAAAADVRAASDRAAPPVDESPLRDTPFAAHHRR